MNRKFQYAENMYTTKILIPITVFYSISCVLVLPFELYTYKYTQEYGAFDIRIQLCLMISFLMFTLNNYTIIFYVILKFPPIQSRLNINLKTWRFCTRRVSDDQHLSAHHLEHNVATQTHFEQLERCWK